MRRRYPTNWVEIALERKNAAQWRCKHCRATFPHPDQITQKLTRSERSKIALACHHANFTPEDNRPENLIVLCNPCHLALHARCKRSNVSPGQLSLFDC